MELAHDVIRSADQLGSKIQPHALGGLRQLLRAMNSYYTNKIEGQHTRPLEIEQALRNEYSTDAEQARKQRLAVHHMAAEHTLEAAWSGRLDI